MNGGLDRSRQQPFDRIPCRWSLLWRRFFEAYIHYDTRSCTTPKTSPSYSTPARSQRHPPLCSHLRTYSGSALGSAALCRTEFSDLISSPLFSKRSGEDVATASPHHVEVCLLQVELDEYCSQHTAWSKCYPLHTLYHTLSNICCSHRHLRQ